MNRNIMRKAGFGKEVDEVKRGICPRCGEVAEKEGFRDIQSRKEFVISGLCQKCQDKIFGTN